VNSTRAITVTADVEDGYNNALLARDLQTKLKDYQLPEGYTIQTSGELENINTMLSQMMLLLILGFVLGSLPELFPGFPVSVPQWLMCLFSLALGGGAIWLLSSQEA
jgi:multidrug efflux pump subunit AcrB